MENRNIEPNYCEECGAKNPDECFCDLSIEHETEQERLDREYLEDDGYDAHTR